MEALHTLIGLSAAAAYTEIVRQLPEVAAMALVEQRPPPVAQERTPLGEHDQARLARAVAMKDAVRLPFWDAVMLTILADGADGTSILDVALYHRSHRGRERWLSREQILAGAFGEASSRATPGATVSLLSEIRAGTRETIHLPMVDFHCPTSPTNLRVAAAVGRRLLPAGGLIIDSGHSYHLVGSHAVTTDCLVEFLAKASLFGAIVDRAYIAHQIIERRCALRLSRGGHSGAEPTVALAF